MKKAVALHYHQQLPAPIVVAKGKGELARIITRLAEEHEISVVEMPELTDAMVELEMGSLIPEEYYQVIAELLVFVHDMGAVA